jgi:H+/gluconate symporter-like permease
VAPIAVAAAARLYLTVAAVGVDLAAGIAAVVDVLPPGDTEAIANQFLKQAKAPLANTSGAFI